MPFDSKGTEYLSRRVEAERLLGRRSFYDFYLMAWPYMDPAAFVPGKHIRLITHHLQLAARREVRRLFVGVPPRYSKSLLCSVAFPAWVWTWWPSAKFITCSYDQKLASRDSLAARRLIEHPWYRARWPEVKLERDQHQKMWYQTTAGGMRYVGSPATGVTGHGADFAIFDDPHDVTRSESEADRVRAVTFWFESMSSRFNDPTEGVSVVVGQRVHQNDVQGECIRRGYETVVLPARFEPDHPERSSYDWRRLVGEPLWPEKFTEEALEELWGALREYAVAAQQQQRPTAREGGLFKREWFETVELLPDNLVWARGWDLAGTEKSVKADPDWTAGVKLGRDPATNILYVASVIRLREDPGGVQNRIKAVAQQDGPGVKIGLPQDPAQAGKFQAQIYTTQVLAGYAVQTFLQSATKIDRADPFAAQCRAGNVKIYRALWNDAFLDELCCAVQDTQVITAEGIKPICRVRVGDRVLTRFGWRPVLKSGQTGRGEVCEISLSNGRCLRVTPNHPIFVPGYGFKNAGLLRVGESLLQSTGVLSFDDMPVSDISQPLSMTTTCFSTASSMNKKLDRFLMDIRSIMRTKIQQTTRWQTSSVFQHPGIRRSILSVARCDESGGIIHVRSAVRRLLEWLAPDVAAIQCSAPGLARIEPVLAGMSPYTPGRARFVPRPTWAVNDRRNTAACNVPGLVGDVGRASVSSAAKSSFPAWPSASFAANTVRVEGMRPLDGQHDVYNLEVEEVPEFVAEGVLVHNSFPAGGHDDQVDAAATAYMLLMDPTTGILDWMREQALARRA